MHILLTFLLMLLLQSLIAVVVALPTWLLWNWIAVSVFELPAMSIMQILGLLLLLSFLFGRRLTIEHS
jgi:hypothetical protein